MRPHRSGLLSRRINTASWRPTARLLRPSRCCARALELGLGAAAAGQSVALDVARVLPRRRSRRSRASSASAAHSPYWARAPSPAQGRRCRSRRYARRCAVPGASAISITKRSRSRPRCATSSSKERQTKRPASTSRGSLRPSVAFTPTRPVRCSLIRPGKVDAPQCPSSVGVAPNCGDRVERRLRV